jgi:hypothetical protein
MSIRRAGAVELSNPIARRWVTMALLALSGCAGSTGGSGADAAPPDLGAGEGDGPLDGTAGDTTAGPGSEDAADAGPYGSAIPAPDGPEGTAWVGPACAAGAARFCQKLMECAPLFLDRLWTDLGSCTDRMRLDCEHDAFSRDSSLTFQTVTTCTGALDVTSCSDFFGRRIEACWSRGQRPDGDRCGSSKQCQSGYCNLQGECGYCAARGGVGQPCGAVESCQTGLLCAGGVCLQPGHLDEACSTQSPCDLALYCQDGHCRPAGTEGQDCVGATSCDYWKGLYCNPSIGKCQHFLRAGPGEPCGVVPGGIAYCVPGGNCADVDAMGTGRCVGLVGEGESCVMRSCSYPARCGDGICRLPDSARCP